MSNISKCMWRHAEGLGVLAKWSLECSLEGSWEPGKLPSKNSRCAQSCVLKACHCSWVIFRTLQSGIWTCDLGNQVARTFASDCTATGTGKNGICIVN